jgi:calreticulin
MFVAQVTIPAKADDEPHVYTLVVTPDNKYRVLIDMSEVASGNLEDDWDFLKPKTIPDPDAKKPEDWDDRAEVCFIFPFVCRCLLLCNSWAGKLFA